MQADEIIAFVWKNTGHIAERWYYFAAILMIFLSIVAFMWSFERRKPKAREVVLLAVMTSIAVIGRVALFMAPQIKPCAAIIIITGIMLGKEAGFLCGTLTAFVSDFFFGQGPWTIWQMFAFGLIGLLSAIVFSGKLSEYKYNKYILCSYGFMVVFLMYGVIMDVATVLMYTDNPGIFVFLTTYMAGFVFNIIHGGSTAVFLWLLANPFFNKIKRIKIKYGMYHGRR